MDDCISRQAAIDALDGNIIVTSRESAQAVMDYIRECADRIRSLPSAQPEDKCGECDAWNQYKNYPRRSQWIPVSERLPEKPNMYTVTDSKGDVARFVFNDTESSREYWLRCAKAWMPLPEPWRGESNEL